MIPDSISRASSQSTHLNMSLWFLSVAVIRKRSSLFSHYWDNEQDTINWGEGRGGKQVYKSLS